MELLVFQLQGELAAWGEPAVGENRATHAHPSQSALVGLLCAALGLQRDDPAIARMAQGYAYAIGIQHSGRLLRDFHTAQVPSRADLKGRPHRSRRDELAVPELGAILSKRDYRQQVAYLIAVKAQDGAPHPLAMLQQALQQPRFVLYLGRKSCPPSAPLAPQLVQADSVRLAFDTYLRDLTGRIEATQNRWGRASLPPPSAIDALAWDDAMVADMGVEPDLSVTRKDRVLRRRGWQFGDRIEHLHKLPPPVPEQPEIAEGDDVLQPDPS
jgi:CRISPR system Cascade subunit CasD